MLREILENSYLDIINGEKILVYDVGTYKMIKKDALWLILGLVDPLQVLTEHDKMVAIRWLKMKNITMWKWSDDVWDLIYEEFNNEKTKE